jgi:hypothetical protein
MSIWLALFSITTSPLLPSIQSLGMFIKVRLLPRKTALFESIALTAQAKVRATIKATMIAALIRFYYPNILVAA